MARGLQLLLLGLCGGAVVHIAILFLLPAYSQRDAWSALAARGDLYSVVALAGPEAPRERLPRVDDPLLQAAACRFDLGDGIVRIQAEGRVPFWSLSIYDRDGFNVFSLNDRSGAGAQVDVAVVDPSRMLQLRKGLPQTLERAVLVEADLREGMAVVRAFVPDDSWGPTVAAFLEGMRCAPL